MAKAERRKCSSKEEVVKLVEKSKQTENRKGLLELVTGRRWSKT